MSRARQKETGLSKTLFMTDSYAKVFVDRGICDWDGACGHDMIRRLYDVYDVHSQCEHESFWHVPKEIAKAVNNGEMDQLYLHDDDRKDIRLAYPGWLPRFDKYNLLILPARETCIFLKWKDILPQYLESIDAEIELMSYLSEERRIQLHNCIHKELDTDRPKTIFSISIQDLNVNKEDIIQLNCRYPRSAEQRLINGKVIILRDHEGQDPLDTYRSEIEYYRRHNIKT